MDYIDGFDLIGMLWDTEHDALRTDILDMISLARRLLVGGSVWRASIFQVIWREEHGGFERVFIHTFKYRSSLASSYTLQKSYNKFTWHLLIPCYAG